MYTVIQLKEAHTPLIEEFCAAADRAGFANNSSIRKMKFNGDYDLGTTPAFWGIVKDNKLISVSGCHLWFSEDLSTTSLRCLFRSATLPDNNIIPGISKNHMNSAPFSIMLPHQIRWGKTKGCNDMFITTSHGDHDASGKMKRTHRALEILATRGVVEFYNQIIFYDTPQTTWKINVDRYYEILKSFHTMREQLGIGLTSEYYDIINNGFNV
jgi:hypothetical protein